MNNYYQAAENAANTPTDRKPKRDEYRGNPLLVLPMGEDREFSFGVGKARAILKHIEEIKKFVSEFEPNQTAAFVAAGLGEDKH